MKKIILLISLSFITFQAISQRKFGIIAGVSNSGMAERIGEGVYFQFDPKPQFGVFYELDLSNRIDFRPRLMYSQQGYRMFELASSASYNSISYNLNYINASMDFKFWNKIYLIAGPQVGFLISEKQISYNPGPAESSIDFGANLGLGVSIRNVFLELGAYHGFSDVLKNPNNNNYKNVVARFSCGWRIL